MKRLSTYQIGVCFGLISAIGSAIIAVILSDHKEVHTSWLLLIQSAMALLFSFIHGGTGKLLKNLHPRAALEIRTSRYPTHLLRALAGLGIYAFYYSSLKFAPRVDCSLLLNTAPLFVPFFGIMIFSDRVSYRTWVGILVGFLGIALVLQPGLDFRGIQIGHFFALFGGICFALSTVIVRDLNQTEDVATTLLYYNLHSVLGLLLFIGLNWQTPTWAEIQISLLIGLIFTIKIHAIHLSIKKASAITATILNFATIPMLALYGVIVGKESLLLTTTLGTILVIGSAISVSRLSRLEAVSLRRVKLSSTTT